MLTGLSEPTWKFGFGWIQIQNKFYINFFV